ncbi:MAG: phosphoribosylglycinamide synthetase C domain-containing protein, partial [Huintestinicola sp.]
LKELVPGKAVYVVMASGGYPKDYKKGYEITIPEEIADSVYIAGAKKENGKLLTDGGRVLNSVAVADTLENALKKAYENTEKIKFENSYLRRDIGQRALKAKEVG